MFFLTLCFESTLLRVEGLLGTNIFCLDTKADSIRHANDLEEHTQNQESQSSAPNPMASLPLAGAVFGLCLGGPVGLVAGAKLGGVAAIGGSILGYAGASVIKEQKEMRKFMEEYKKREQEMHATGSVNDATSTVNVARRGRGGERKTNLSPEARRRKRIQRQQKLTILQPNRPTTEERVCIKRQPPHLQLRHVRNISDLTEKEQSSILALINKNEPEVVTKTLIVTAIVCDAQADQDTNSAEVLNKTKKQRRSNEEKMLIRASSLPAVLEEDQIQTLP